MKLEPSESNTSPEKQDITIPSFFGSPDIVHGKLQAVVLGNIKVESKLWGVGL